MVMFPEMMTDQYNYFTFMGCGFSSNDFHHKGFCIRLGLYKLVTNSLLGSLIVDG
jgi:hypothetical protein